MPRHAKFSEAQILDATAELVAAAGPSALTIGAVGVRLGAPSGSIYHRFAARNVLLGRLWLSKAKSFQDRFVAALSDPDPVVAGCAGALSLPGAVRNDMAGARILLLHRREDFLSGEWPADMQAEAVRLKQQVDDALADISRRLFGSGDARLLRIATLAILDVAFAAVRRHVAANEVPPAYVDDLVRSAYAALIPSARGRMPTEQGEQPMDATQTSTETPFGEADRQLNAMIAAGRAREAFEQFLDDDVVMQENADPPTRGKQANRRREAPFFEAVAKLEATLLGSATANDTSYSEWRYVVDFKDGSRWDFYQVAARRWKGAKVIHERYYHPHFPTRSQLA